MNKPLFARFLDKQLSVRTNLHAGAPPRTLKYPSDSDEWVTLKYPSDGDEDYKF